MELSTVKLLLDYLFNNFTKIIASAMLPFIIFYIFKRSNNNQDYIKVIGLLLIFTIALFENKSTAYILALIITAALFVNNDFLEKIVAIIWRNNEYFEYRKSKATEEDEEKNIEITVADANESIMEIVQTPTKSIDEIENDIKQKRKEIRLQYKNITDKTIKYLEKLYGKPLEREVKFSNKYNEFICDAILHSNDKDIIYEIKILSPNNPPFMPLMPKNYISSVADYAKSLNKPVELQYVFIITNTESNHERIKYFISRQINKYSTDFPITITPMFLTIDDIKL